MHRGRASDIGIPGTVADTHRPVSSTNTMNFEFEQPNSLLTAQSVQQGTTSLDPTGIIDGLSKFLSFGIGDVLDLPPLQDKNNHTADDEPRRSLNGTSHHKNVQRSTSQQHRNGSKQPASPTTSNPTRSATRSPQHPAISQREQQAQEELLAAAQHDQDLQVHLRKLLKDSPDQQQHDEEQDDNQQPAIGLSLEGFFSGFSSIKQRATSLLDTLDAKFDSMFNPGEDEVTASAASHTQRHAGSPLNSRNSPTRSNARLSANGSENTQANNSSQQPAKLVVNANRGLKSQASTAKAKLNARPLCNKNHLQSPANHKHDSHLVVSQDGNEPKPRAGRSIAISKSVPAPHDKLNQGGGHKEAPRISQDSIADTAGVPDQNLDVSTVGTTGNHHGEDSHHSCSTHTNQPPQDEVLQTTHTAAMKVQDGNSIINNSSHSEGGLQHHSEQSQQQHAAQPQQQQGVHPGVVSGSKPAGSLSALLDPSCAGCSVTKRLLKAASKKVNDLAADNARLRGAALLDPVLSDSICAQLQSLLADKARLLLDNCRLQREVAGLQQLLAYTWEQQTMWLDEDTAALPMPVGSPAIPLELSNGIYQSPIDSHVTMGCSSAHVKHLSATSIERNSASHNNNATCSEEAVDMEMLEPHQVGLANVQNLLQGVDITCHSTPVRHASLQAVQQPQACLPEESLQGQPCQQACQSSTHDEIAEIHQYYSELLADIATPHRELPDWLTTPMRLAAEQEQHSKNQEQHVGHQQQPSDDVAQPRRLFEDTV